jgi:hypothetical protein
MESGKIKLCTFVQDSWPNSEQNFSESSEPKLSDKIHTFEQEYNMKLCYIAHLLKLLIAPYGLYYSILTGLKA